MLHLIIRGLFLVTSSSLLFGCGPMGWWNNPYGVAIPGYGPGYQPNGIVAEGPAAASAQQATVATASVQTSTPTPSAPGQTTVPASTAPAQATAVTVIVVAPTPPGQFQGQNCCEGDDAYCDGCLPGGGCGGYVPRGYGGWRGPGYFGRGGMYRWR